MKYFKDIKNISKHKKEFKTDKMKIPAILHLSDDLMPNDNTLSEIEAVAVDSRVFKHIAVMSDVHSKKGRKNPTGTVIASLDYILPQINDTAPNCGMRLLKTNLSDMDLKNENLDKLFKELVKIIPTKAYWGVKIPFQVIMDICRKGIISIEKYLKTETKNETKNTFKNGNFFDSNNIPSEKDILDAIPDLFLRIGQYRLGILGAAGNHFLDLMKITKIKNSQIAEKFEIYENQYVFLMHTGSGLLGQYASYLYTPKKKEHLSQKMILEISKIFWKTKYKKEFLELTKKIEKYKNKKEYFAYKDGTLWSKLFITAHNAAANYGFANRCVITHHLNQVIKKTLGKNSQLDLLYDTPHVFINKENHFQKDVWIHRNGAVRAYGPSRISHPVFSETGEPVFIPSSMSSSAYICVGTDENESSFFSASHGTGRRKDPEINAVCKKEELFEKMRKSQVKLFNAKSKNIIFQDRGYYKDVEEVIDGMEKNKIVKIVAKMEPIAVLMY